MDVLKVVENIQKICKERGTNPTLAGRESGAGKDLVSSMKRRGVLPSIEKMMLLADYLGVTVSELIGDTRNTLVTFQHVLPPEDTVDAALEEFSHKVPYFSQNFKSFIDGRTRLSAPDFPDPIPYFWMQDSKTMTLQMCMQTDMESSPRSAIRSLLLSMNSSPASVASRLSSRRLSLRSSVPLPQVKTSHSPHITENETIKKCPSWTPRKDVTPC